MAKSTTVKSQLRKKPGPPATGKGTPVLVRLQPELLEPLDKAAAEINEASRPEVIRRIIRDWLVGHGYLDSHEK